MTIVESHTGPATGRARAVGYVMRATFRPFARASIGAAELGMRVGLGPKSFLPFEALEFVGRAVPAPRGTRTRAVQLPRCAAEWVQADGADADRVVIYLHGGAFVAGGLNSHRRHSATMSRVTCGAVLNVDYRLLPEHPIDAAVEDVVDAYRHVLESGIDAENVALAGDSAGGGLIFLASAAIKVAGLPRPACLVALSPWASMDTDALLTHSNARIDAMLPPALLHAVAQRFVREDASASAVDIDLSGMPPTLIHVGTKEIFLDQCRLLAQRIAAAGGDVRIVYWTGMFHDFQALADVIPEGREAMEQVGQFVRKKTGR